MKVGMSGRDEEEVFGSDTTLNDILQRPHRERLPRMI